ncbi:hypothetical protein COT75_00185 [Candidatus Beckwithbacteria bacterium CG10_big_fil_rev_8_21_14_0_10_34_10]|uniref:ribose-phosphate diphosphokinase n=1 Tax=Candidatus Beckwithbacteria bacterium CG10_big_fil_rev_8_21_14_0_10_34_10 TaxID=1974495 RepID=A0A2H0WCI0_9BACT|nr:MAG: hypothetical protein COT75_00185 [Candidatus Beckwithbacteria bacterium CG10_big_fil_rev_8_21_14_0_10_34_10]
MKIFSGSASQKLGIKIANDLNLSLEKIYLGRFSNDESQVWLKAEDFNTTAVLIQSLSRPVDEHLVQFCLMADALKRGGVKKIVAVIPYLAYSKQDKIFRTGEPLSVKVIAKIIQTAKINKFITLDLHNKAIVGFFESPVIELSAIPLFLEYFRKSNLKNTLVVAPDAGSIKASTSFAQSLGLEVAYIDKKRDLSNGKVSILGINRQVKGNNIVMVDDMISTGSTLIETAKFLKKQRVGKITVAVSHHLFVPGVQEKIEQSLIDKLIITDTIERSNKKQYKKLKVLSVAPIIVKELRKI